MSFLTEVAVRRMALSSRVASVQASRQFTTTFAARKTVTEAAKDTIKTVDRKVSDKLVDGINASTKAAEAVTGKAADANQKAAGTAQEIRDKAKSDSAELAGEAKGAINEAKGTIKGAAKETEGKVKGSL
jgi:F0F1-type ATP synthase membrane subunit b/b'